MRSKLTTIILIGMVLGILVGYACHIALARSEDGEDDRRLHLAVHRHLPAPDQDDHRAAGVLDPGGRRRAHGRHQGGRPHRRQGDGLVRRGLAGVAAAGPDPGQHPAARRQSQPAAARRRRFDQPQGRIAVDEGIRRASRAALDRRGDGHQRDPADRRVLVVLRRRLRGARRARPQAGRRHRGAVARHPDDHRLHHGAGADRGVRVDGRDRDDPGARHPRDLRQVRRRVLLRACRCCGAC